MKLYYHTTDGGAVYLCTAKITGTEAEGDLHTALIRLDGKPEICGNLNNLVTMKEKENEN